MFFRSLKKEILLVTLGLTILTIIITATLGAFSTQTAVNDAEKATSDTLINQSTESLIKLAESMAKQQDILFENFRRDASNLASDTKNIYDNPSIFSYGNYWQFDKRVFLKDGVYLNSENDISTFHIPNFVVLDAEEKRDIELTAGLDFIAPSILSSNPNIAALYTIDDKGVTRYYPNIVLGSLAPPDYDPRPDIYYKPATPEENPEKKVVWSPLYEDVAGRGLMITASAPVYTKNGFQGIASVDVFLKDIIKTITEYQPIEGSYAFLIDREGNTVAFPDKAYKDILGRSQKKGEARTMLAGGSVSSEFSTVLNKMMKGEKGVGSFHSGEKELFIAYAPLNQTGFSMAVVAERASMLKAVAALQTELSDSIRETIVVRILPVSLLIILIATIISVFIVARVVKPIEDLKKGVREIGSGNLDYNLKTKSRDEIGELASSFNQMSGALKKSREELYEYSQGLEQKIKERTQEISEANERLKQLDRLKDDFVSVASHELRTPMTAIKSYLWMALAGQGGSLNEKQRHYIQRGYNSVDRLIKLVNDMLNISRIDSGRLTVQVQSINIEQLVKEVVEEVTPRASELGVGVSVEKHGVIPEVLADSDKIKEVVFNLIGNSMKFTPSGGRITVSFEQKENMVEVVVSDTGAGIDPEDLSKLFQKFGILPGSYITNQPTLGTGLGLYICRSLIELHGGKIWVASEGKGKGATFTFSLKVFSQEDLDKFNAKYAQESQAKVGLIHSQIS